ncbi:helix-turn-helix domain-containing protein [Roseomonas populi]|uniref:helix-turn-helix domain-containing protein n=1 Tax=Roseomonas populi TaxID=3121582 RepID=UPI002FCD262A
MGGQHKSSKVTHPVIMTPAQCRAARALLNWSQDQLEAAAKVARKTIADFEREARTPYDRTLAAIRTALEAAGVEFISEDGGGPGVRLTKANL